MKKEVVLLLIAVLFVQAASAIDVDDELLSATLTRAEVSGAVNLYAYEVNFSINSGSVSSVNHYGFLGSGGGVSSGSNQRNSYLYVYQSKLDSTHTGVSGSGYLFNITHSSGANLTLRGATFIYADGSIERKSYNVPAPVCGNGVEETGETCDDGNTNSGDECSSTCQDEVVNNQNTGGPGGGGPPPALNTTNVNQNRTLTYRENKNIKVEPAEFDLNIVQGVQVEREFTITYTGLAPLDIVLSAEGNIMNGVSFDEERFRLYPNSPKKVKFGLVVNEKGVQTGSILIIEGSNIEKKVPITANVKSENFLFEVGLEIPEEYQKVNRGEDILAQISLVQIGPQLKIDTTANYFVKDFDGNSYEQQSESFEVLGEKQYSKQFSTSNLNPGKYVLGLEIVYSGAFATSSAQFEVLSGEPTGVGKVGIIILGAACLISFISLVVFLWGWWKKRKQLR